MNATNPPGGFSRRNFLTTTAASTMTLTLLDSGHASAAPPPAPGVTPDTRSPHPVNLRVNGQDHRLTLDVRTTLARRVARAHGTDRQQKRLRPRPVRRLHGDGRRPARAVLPDARRDASKARTSRPSKASPSPTARCIRCSRPSSITTPSSAATARPGRSCRPSPACKEGHADTDARHPRIHERQSVPLRRLSEHRRRRQATPSRK